jgi:hypothetical protein
MDDLHINTDHWSKEFDKLFARLQSPPLIIDPTQPEITTPEVPIEHEGGASTTPTPSALDT